MGDVQSRTVAERDELLAASKTLVEALDKCRDTINGVFLFAQLHGRTAPDMPTYGHQLEALRSVLEAIG